MGKVKDALYDNDPRLLTKSIKYRKKPVEIEAMLLTKDTLSAVVDFAQPAVLFIDDERGAIRLFTLEGQIWARSGDYVIKGIKGEFYPCRQDIFNLTYESVETQNANS
jgi:hypothetical protein